MVARAQRRGPRRRRHALRRLPSPPKSQRHHCRHGTRRAAFRPLQNLGLIIVDEEQESSYKQEETPRYHGRDVAIVRAKLENAIALLGSATPSLETYHHARSGKYELLTLPARVA